MYIYTIYILYIYIYIYIYISERNNNFFQNFKLHVLKLSAAIQQLNRGFLENRNHAAHIPGKTQDVALFA